MRNKVTPYSVLMEGWPEEAEFGVGAAGWGTGTDFPRNPRHAAR